MNYSTARFSTNKTLQPTLYTETEAVEPTQEDIEEYARRIGIDPETEPHLLHLARSGLLVKLPVDWKPCKDSHRDVWFYYNNITHVSQWDHPMDAIFKEKVIEARQEHAMNRMQSLDVNLAPKPLKSLPPLKKSGGGLNPLTFPSSPLNRLGPLRNASFGSSDDISQFSGSSSFQNTPKSNSKSLLQPLEPLRKSQPLPLNNPPQQLNHPLNGVGSTNKINSNAQIMEREPVTRQRIKVEASPPAPVKKVGLTLTGTGASFLKSAKPNLPTANSDVAKIDKQDRQDETPTASGLNGNGVSSKDTKDTVMKSLYEKNKIDSASSTQVIVSPEVDAKYPQRQIHGGNNQGKLIPREQSSTSVVDLDTESTGIGKPLKSILANSSFKNRVRLDENENPSTTMAKKNLWEISPRDMTDEEYNLWSALDYKRQTSVKFNLDDPKLTFEFSNPEESDNHDSDNSETEDDESEEDDEDEEIENSADYDGEEYNNGERSNSEILKLPQGPSNSGDGIFSNQSAVHTQSDKAQTSKIPGNNFQVQNSAVGAPLSSAHLVSVSKDLVVDRATIKAAMEKQVKEYEAKIEEEEKQQKQQIRNNMEQNVSLLKSEMEYLIERTKGDFELHKKMEVEKARAEMETTLMKDLEKLRTEYNEKLNKKKQELESDNETAMKNLDLQNQEQLKQVKNDPKFIEAKQDYEKQLQEEIQLLKSTMNEQHKKQIEEMKNHHHSTVQQLKATFKTEEEKLQKEHTDLIVSMLAKFDTEKQNLLRSFQTEQDKIKQEFAAKASELTSELSQNLETMRFDLEEKVKQTSRLPEDINKGSSSESLSKAEALKKAEEELASLKMKYKELEGKYANLKKGVQNVVSDEQAKLEKRPSSSISEDRIKAQIPSRVAVSDSHHDMPYTDDHDQNNTIDSGAAESDTSFSMSSSAANPVEVRHPSTPSVGKIQSSDIKINKMMTDSNSRLNQALTALDDLKKQILDIKAEQKQIGSRTDLSESDDILQQQSPSPQQHYSDAENPADEIKILHQRKKPSVHNITLPLATNEARMVRARMSRSDFSIEGVPDAEVKLHTISKAPYVSTKDSNLNNADDRNYIIEAKDFIKSQKYRLKRSGLAFGTPVSTSVGAKHRHESKYTNSFHSKRFNEPHSQILQSYYENEKKKNQSPILKFDSNHSNSQDHHHSETESSGVGSLKEQGSTVSGDKSKIGQDIEGILSSLQQLDGQMKYLWSVVSGTDTSVNSTSTATPLLNNTPSSRPSAATIVPPAPHPQRTILGTSGPVTQTPLSGYRDPISFSDVAMKYNLAPNLITPGNQALINSINVANTLQFRRAEITSNPVPVLTTLEEHVNNIRNRQNRILKQYPIPGESSSGRNHPNHSPSISERTKDLREWLEKF